jgi:hypothetical protein
MLKGGGLADAEAVSHTCAALKFCWRALIYDEALRLMNLNYERHAKVFDTKFRQYIEPGNRTSWDSIKEAMDSAKHALDHKTTLGGYEWVTGTEHRAMILNGKYLSLTNLSTAITLGVSATVNHLVDNILDGLSLYLVPRVIPIDQRRADLRNKLSNYSFILDPNNPYLDFADTLLKHLVFHEKLGKFDGNLEFKWDTRACRTFLEQTSIVREMLYVLIHFVAGAVDRTTEGSALTWCDDGWRASSMKWAHEMVMLLSTHNKTNAMTGADKPIAR